MNIIKLAELIHDHTGAEGAELQCLTFYVAAGFADALGRKDIGAYFDGRLQASKRQLPPDHRFRKRYT